MTKRASAQSPVLVSACLLGEPCRYDGASKAHPEVCRLAERGVVVPVCPECLGGLGTPRPPCEIRGDRVVNRDGTDRTLEYQTGAQLAFNAAQTRGCTRAILKARSPSCGLGRVYDGTFSRTLCEGDGVFAALLRQEGLEIWTEENAPFGELLREEPDESPAEAHKRAILLVAYGAGNPQSAATLRQVKAEVEKRFDLPVRWAYTSETLRHRIAEARMKSDSVLKALRRMAFEHFDEVAVQSLHIIPGVEYDGVLSDVEQARKELPCDIRVGLPLLFSPEDTERAAPALLEHISFFRTGNEPVICMGHGSLEHGASALYEALSRSVRKLDDSVYVACMKGAIELEDVLAELRQRGDEVCLADPDDSPVGASGTLRLLPLLSVSGRHARHDMAGRHGQSWRSRIENAGFLCQTDVRGLADTTPFVDLWMERLAAVVESFEPASGRKAE